LLPSPTHVETHGVAPAALSAGAALPIATRRTITDFDNVAVSQLAMNTHPLHTDYLHARATRFGRPLVVSPFLLSCLCALVVNELEVAAIGALEIRELAFERPVHPGDTIGAQASVVDVHAHGATFEVIGVKDGGERFARFLLALDWEHA